MFNVTFSFAWLFCAGKAFATEVCIVALRAKFLVSKENLLPFVHVTSCRAALFFYARQDDVSLAVFAGNRHG